MKKFLTCDKIKKADELLLLAQLSDDKGRLRAYGSGFATLGTMRK